MRVTVVCASILPTFLPARLWCPPSPLPRGGVLTGWQRFVREIESRVLIPFADTRAAG